MSRPTQRPIQKLAAAASHCSIEAAAYGKCVVVDYNTVEKNKCISKFVNLRECYLKAVVRK